VRGYIIEYRYKRLALRESCQRSRLRESDRQAAEWEINTFLKEKLVYFKKI